MTRLKWDIAPTLRCLAIIIKTLKVLGYTQRKDEFRDGDLN